MGLKQNLFDGVLSETNRLDVVDFSAGGRAQFLAELELAMSEMLHPQPLEEVMDEEHNISSPEIPVTDISDIVKEEEPEEQSVATETISAAVTETTSSLQAKQIEQVMQNGMNFLSGLYQMATGKSIAPEDQKISIDSETGEVVMRFKMKW